MPKRTVSRHCASIDALCARSTMLLEELARTKPSPRASTARLRSVSWRPPRIDSPAVWRPTRSTETKLRETGLWELQALHALPTFQSCRGDGGAGEIGEDEGASSDSTICYESPPGW